MKCSRLKETKGALVAEVKKRSSAETAGIKRDDVIVGFDGKEVAEVGHLPALVAATPIDKSVPVKVGRMPGERAEAAKTGQADSVAGGWGMALRDLDARMAQRAGVVPGEGVRVMAVKPDSAAEGFGVRPGGVIRELNRHKVTSGAEAQADAKKQAAGGSLLLLRKRGDATLFAALEQK